MIEGEDNDIKMVGDLARSYTLIASSAKKRFEENKVKPGKCQMTCKSLEQRFIAFDQYGNIFPCFLYRIYNPNEKFDLNYEKINNFTYDFCYECEAITTHLLEKMGLERMG